MSTPLWPPLPRRLPLPHTPVHNETQESYLRRLAIINRITIEHIDDLGCLDDTDPHWLTRLARITGSSPHTLVNAIPDLTDHPSVDPRLVSRPIWPIPKIHINTVQPACRRCAAAADADPATTMTWATHDINICPTHRAWIGPGNHGPHQQIDLTACPDVLGAQRRHRRLIHRYGRPRVRAAFTAATGLWYQYGDTDGYTRQRDARLAILAPGSPPTSSDDETATTQAAIYPEIVAMTTILATRHWRDLVYSEKPADHRLLHDEIHRRVTPAHNHPGPPRFLFWLRRNLEHVNFDEPETATRSLTLITANRPDTTRHQKRS